MKITSRKLSDYPLKSVEEVRIGDKVIGLLEHQKQHMYKAFVGSGFDCRYLSTYLSKVAAVLAVINANEAL